MKIKLDPILRRMREVDDSGEMPGGGGSLPEPEAEGRFLIARSGAAGVDDIPTTGLQLYFHNDGTSCVESVHGWQNTPAGATPSVDEDFHDIPRLCQAYDLCAKAQRDIVTDVWSASMWYRFTADTPDAYWGEALFGLRFGRLYDNVRYCYGLNFALVGGNLVAYDNYPENRYGTLGPLPVRDGKWHHIVITCAKLALAVYVDGSLVLTGQLTLPGSIDANRWDMTGLQSGWNHVGFGVAFVNADIVPQQKAGLWGDYAELRYYAQYLLGGQEVRALYNAVANPGGAADSGLEWVQEDFTEAVRKLAGESVGGADLRILRLEVPETTVDSLRLVLEVSPNIGFVPKQTLALQRDGAGMILSTGLTLVDIAFALNQGSDGMGLPPIWKGSELYVLIHEYDWYPDWKEGVLYYRAEWQDEDNVGITNPTTGVI